MVASACVILRAGERLSNFETERLAELANVSGARSIILDMSRVLEATMPAMARLVRLRRELLQRGCHVRVAGVRGQPARLMEVHRLYASLPPINQVPAELPARPKRFPPHFHAENAVAWSVAR